MGISTHILDTSRGRPAEGVAVTLHAQQDGGWKELARGVTNADGRVKPLLETILSAGAPRPDRRRRARRARPRCDRARRRPRAPGHAGGRAGRR